MGGGYPGEKEEEEEEEEEEVRISWEDLREGVERVRTLLLNTPSIGIISEVGCGIATWHCCIVALWVGHTEQATSSALNPMCVQLPLPAQQTAVMLPVVIAGKVASRVLARTIRGSLPRAAAGGFVLVRNGRGAWGGWGDMERIWKQLIDGNGGQRGDRWQSCRGRIGKLMGIEMIYRCTIYS